jgi:hypothetical protein
MKNDHMFGKMQLRAVLYTFIILGHFICSPLNAQLRLGNVNGEINFREGPGSNFRILHTIDKSNLLVVLPGEARNGYIEAFDVETSSRGYVYESLIRITDTLKFNKQNFFVKSAETTAGNVEIELINSTGNILYVWINKYSYDILPYEKRVLIMDNEEITYFSSAPGLFPVFGKEVLQKGNTYIWKFSQ